MKMMSQIAQSTSIALFTALAALISLAMLYMLVEPQITHSQATETFLIQTNVTGESSFLVPPTNVTMAGTLNSLTGGQATGTTQFVVQSTSPTGYRVAISFPTNGTPNAMVSDTSADTSIVDYQGDAAGPEPSAGFTVSGSAQFAYTVVSSTTADTDDSFFENAGSCNDGGGSQAVTCWKAPQTAAFDIVTTDSPAPTGATSSIIFNVTVPNNPVPVPVAEGYTATATLSLFNI